ncbi:MAG TPA: peptidylprolyl isomerase [Holophagaceae bacterium]|jgi:peptidyl-prolyl cis-trans isomerase C|nr:peptidylprolyl isomerase [Holophagaceae bacterium]
MRPLIMSLLALTLAAQGAPKAKPATKTAKKPVVAAPAAKDPVLAKVGPAVVTESDFQAVLAQMPQQQQMMVQIVQGAKEELVNRIAERKLLSLEAAKRGLDKTPEFARTLAQTKDDLLAREYLKAESPALQAQMKVSDADLQSYFKAHEKDFMTPEKDTARHILLLVNGPATQGKGVTDEAAKAKVAQIQAELKAGKKLEDLAKTYSDDPGSKDKGGLYEDFDPKTMDPAFAKAVETQALGVVGEPVKSMYGYHLIEVEKRTPAAAQTFEQAKEKVTETATKARQEQVWKDLIAKLKTEFPVTLTMPKAPEPKPEAPVAQPAAEPAAQPVAEPAKPEAGK